MSLNDIFRSFFGIPSRGDDSRRRDLFPFDDDGDAEEEDAFGFHGIGQMDDIFRHFQGDMMQQMQEIQRQMDDMLKNFGVTEFPALGPGMPGLEDGTSRPDTDNLRDKMLKPGNEDARKGGTTPPTDDSQPFNVPSIFGGIFNLPNWNPVKPHEKVDQDLDSEVHAGDLSKLFEKPGSEVVPHRPNSDSPRVRSSFRSVSVQKIRKPDGTIEERRTARDSAGNEETTVTRSLGDQSHSVTTRKNPAGQEEVVQNFTNLDEDKLPQFEKLWDSDSGHMRPPDFRPPQVFITPDSSDSSNSSLFRKLFGFSPSDPSR